MGSGCETRQVAKQSLTLNLLEEVASSKNLKRQMREAIKRGKDTGVEYGFPICRTEEGLVAGERETTKGSENRTNVVQGCPLTGGEFVGTFHSHPKNKPYPSRRDLASAVVEKVTCTGQDERVFCLEKKPLRGPHEVKETIEDLSYSEFLGEIPEEAFRKAVEKHYRLREIRLDEAEQDRS